MKFKKAENAYADLIQKLKNHGYSKSYITRLETEINWLVHNQDREKRPILCGCLPYTDKPDKIPGYADNLSEGIQNPGRIRSLRQVSCRRVCRNISRAWFLLAAQSCLP